MSSSKPLQDLSKNHKSFQIIILGSISEYSELSYFQEELNTFVPNLNLVFIQQPSKLTSSMFLNFTNQTIVFILTRTAKDLAHMATKAAPNKNNIVFYLESNEKQAKYMKVASRWEFYKFILKKVQPKPFEFAKKKIDNRMIPICVKVLQSQNIEFNSLLSALSIKYLQNQTIDFRVIPNIKQLLEGRYEKRILIVNNREEDYAKHYLTQVMARDEKVYSILFEGNKISQYNFNTSNISDIEHLLDSLLIKYSRNNQSSQRIKMKSVKKMSERKDGRSKVLVLESQNQKFNDLFMRMEGVTVIKQLKNEHLAETVNVIVNYNECAQALAHVVVNQNLSVLVFAQRLLPNQIYKHPSVKLITDNYEDILRFFKIRGSKILTKQSLFPLEENVSQSLKLSQLPPHPSMASSRLLTKSRGTFHNGMKFMEWDTKFVKSSNGVFCTYPEDEPQKFQTYANQSPSQPSVDYVTFETFGKLKAPGRFRNNTYVTSSSMQPSQQQRQIPDSEAPKSTLSIIQQLAPVVSITDIRQPLNPIQQKGQRSSYSSSDKKSNEFPHLPMQSQLFTQTKSSKIQFSESFDNLYSETSGNNSQMNSKFIHTKQRQSSIQSQSKILLQQPKQRFNSLNIHNGLRFQRESAELTSFLTQNYPSDPRIKDFSQKQLATIQEQPYGMDTMKQSKSLQTDQQYYHKKSPQLKVQQLIEIIIKPELVPSISSNKQLFVQNSNSYLSQSEIDYQENKLRNKIDIPDELNIQLITKRNYNFIQPELHPNTVFNLYEFYTNSELKYIAFRINPQIRTILIVDQVPQSINNFSEYSNFDCIVVPGSKLYQYQKMRYPHFKWIISQNPEAISHSINKHILNFHNSIRSIQTEPLTVLYFYDQIELQQQLITRFNGNIRYQKYHSPKSLLSHINRSPLAIVLNLPFEWISQEIRSKNPQAHVITYSNGSRVFERNGTIGLARKKEQIVEWISKII